MKNVTRPDDYKKCYMYKGEFIIREHNGLYVTFTNDGRLAADTQRGMMRLITDYKNKGGK